MRSSLYGLYKLGYSCVTMVKTIKKQFCKKEQNYKFYLSSDCGLQLVRIKLESLVIANHYVAVNLYMNPAHTARHMLGVDYT
jgi:hypothetical protein